MAPLLEGKCRDGGASPLMPSPSLRDFLLAIDGADGALVAYLPQLAAQSLTSVALMRECDVRDLASCGVTIGHARRIAKALAALPSLPAEGGGEAADASFDAEQSHLGNVMLGAALAGGLAR